jgi:hypothetical protein
MMSAGFERRSELTARLRVLFDDQKAQALIFRRRKTTSLGAASASQAGSAIPCIASRRKAASRMRSRLDTRGSPRRVVHAPQCFVENG